MVDSKKNVGARLAAKGNQNPDLREGSVGTFGRVRLRSSHQQVISLAALTKWKIWSLDIRKAFQQASGFGRDVYSRAPAEWGPSTPHRTWKLHAPAYGLNHAAAENASPPREYPPCMR